VQVDPIKPKLKPPGSKRLIRKCDEPLSMFAFSFNLRCFIQELRGIVGDDYTRIGKMSIIEEGEAGAYTRPLLGSTHARFVGCDEVRWVCGWS
jgi:hypothetical protein